MKIEFLPVVPDTHITLTHREAQILKIIMHKINWTESTHEIGKFAEELYLKLDRGGPTIKVNVLYKHEELVLTLK